MTRYAIMIAALGAATMAASVIATTAEAARCPSGQFYRVSKKICQSKAIGIKLGIFKAKKSRKKSPKREVTKAAKAAAEPTERSVTPAIAPIKPPTNTPTPSAPVADVPPPLPPARAAAVSNGNPLDAINSAMAGGQTGDQAKPIATRMVKAMYFTASGLASPVGAGDPDIGRRAVLNLLKSRLRIHADRFRNMYLRRALNDG